MDASPAAEAGVPFEQHANAADRPEQPRLTQLRVAHQAAALRGDLCFPVWRVAASSRPLLCCRVEIGQPADERREPSRVQLLKMTFHVRTERQIRKHLLPTTPKVSAVGAVNPKTPTVTFADTRSVRGPREIIDLLLSFIQIAVGQQLSKYDPDPIAVPHGLPTAH